MFRVVTWALAALLVAWGSSSWLRRRPTPAEASPPFREHEVAPQHDSIDPSAPPRPGVAAAPTARVSLPSRLAIAAPSSDAPAVIAKSPDEAWVAGPGNENLVPGAKPHPITSEHQRRYREVGLLESTWEALEARDFVKARELIAAHRREYDGENADLDEGMTLLADCMQHPSAETRARARRFFDEETYSTARRRIRRWCLEP